MRTRGKTLDCRLMAGSKIENGRSMTKCGSVSQVPATKRLLDFACILFVLPALVPITVAVGTYIKLVSRGPILFRQERVGHLERRFMGLKFRSMHVGADSRTHESHTTQLLKSNLPLTKMDVRGDDRLIPLGRLIRASGIDELPQLLNVLRGEMSIVGPRPCTAYEYALLRDDQKTRFRTLPGMTGLWQVCGKNKTTFSQMIDLDAAYVVRWSIGLDLKILLRTLPVLGHQVIEICRVRLAEYRAKRSARAAAVNPAVAGLRGQRSEVGDQKSEIR